MKTYQRTNTDSTILWTGIAQNRDVQIIARLVRTTEGELKVEIPADNESYFLTSDDWIEASPEITKAVKIIAVEEKFQGHPIGDRMSGYGMEWQALLPTTGGVSIERKIRKVNISPNDAPDFQVCTGHSTEVKFENDKR